MPHFVIECSKNVIHLKAVDKVIHEVHAIAEDSGLFAPEAIKVRLRAYENFSCGTDDSDFIHVFASIMDGRTTAQKKQLSKTIVRKLIELYPSVPNVAMNVWDM